MELEIVLSLCIGHLHKDSIAPTEPNLREHQSRFHYRRSLAFRRVSEVFNAFSQNGGRKNVRDQYNLAENVRDQFFSPSFFVQKSELATTSYTLG